MKARAQFFRFRLWHTFVLFFVVAILLWAISAAEHNEWRRVHIWLEESIAKFDVEPDKQAMHQLDDGKRVYAILNYEADWNPDTGDITINTTAIRKGVYFIIPPGKWAKNSEEALMLLKNHYLRSNPIDFRTISRRSN